jgi:hypothetical protein
MNPAPTGTRSGKVDISREVSIILADRSGKPHQIQADAAGNLPSRFELLKVGYWHTMDHGDIMISPQDLQEYYDHYLAGYGRSGGEDGADRSKLPINFGHKAKEKAAGWFAIALEGDTLWAVEVEWSKTGKEELLGKEWKFISAEFYPVGRGGWGDPLDYTNWIENVIDGAALTNIPLYYTLEPVMASRATGFKTDKSPGIFLVNASQEKENTMDLATIRTKNQNDLTEEEKTFVAQNKAQLNAEEQAKFGLEVTASGTEPNPADNPTNTNTPPKEGAPAVNDEATEKQVAAVTASLEKKGMAVISADRLKALEDTATSYEKEKATSVVKAHIARGAIVADQEDKWTRRLMASRGTERKELESDLQALPSNQRMAAKQGAGEDAAGDATSIADELKTKTIEHQKQVKADSGRELTYGQAQDELLRSNDELRGRVEAARK